MNGSKPKVKRLKRTGKQGFPVKTAAAALATVLVLLLIFNPLPEDEVQPGQGSANLPHAFNTESPFDLPEPQAPKNPAECAGFLAEQPTDLAKARSEGASWARPYPGPFAWESIQKEFNGSLDFSEADAWVEAAQQQDVSILGTLWPFASWDADCRGDYCYASESDEFYDSVPVMRCNPCDYPQYQSFLKALVERYDGDGVSDAPNLTNPVKHWQILDEPGANTLYKESYPDYLDLLKQTREAILEACPDCLIVQAGAAGVTGDDLAFWRDFYANGGGDYVDVAAVHSLNVTPFKALLDEYDVNKPIWMTKVAYSDEDDVVRAAKAAFGAGAQKLFFTDLAGYKGLPTQGEYEKAFVELRELCG